MHVFLSEAEGDAHCCDQGKVKWLDVSMAACRGQVSMGMSGRSACAGRYLELGPALCVRVGIRMSQCVCVQEEDSVPVHLQQMICVLSSKVRSKKRDTVLPGSVLGSYRYLSTSKSEKGNLPLTVALP